MKIIPTIQNGVDRLIKEDFGLRGLRLGLITAPTGLTTMLVSTIDILRQGFTLTALFSPEHGVRGDIDDGASVADYTDSRTGVMVYSLYRGDNAAVAYPLDDVDALVIDVQDIGCRYYTFISTMLSAMCAVAVAGKPFVVLDRYNPINGVTVEGNIPDFGFLSFIGCAAIPQRHGMTMGELARLFNANIGCDLRVVSVVGWRREQYGDETGIPWVNPSPAMPSVGTALLYPGTCLFEGTNVSEGRGTTRPFEQIGAPWLDAELLAETLNAQRIPGVIFRPVYFKPWSSKYSGQYCRGVQAHVVDRASFAAVKTGVAMIEAVREQGGDCFEWRKPSSEHSRYFIDLLTASDTLRVHGSAAYLAACEQGAASFQALRMPYLLYQHGGV
ncbi:MAG: DUF1343 domain-containing protein [Treponema sp.]|jgi:uncharacterized protein YbbC (DUF1343 family)|nr:DUF1343 domain-containing protein [Treponema sp.]